MRTLPLIALATLGIATHLPSQAPPPPPPPAILGFEAFRSRGPAAAVEQWVEGSPLYRNRSLIQTLVARLESAGERAGKLLDYDLVHVFALGRYLRTTYAVLRFEREPLFMALTYYQGNNGWELKNIQFNQDASEVFPESLLRP